MQKLVNKQISLTSQYRMQLTKFIASSLKKLDPWKTQLKKVLTHFYHQLVFQRRPTTSLYQIEINQLKQELNEMRKQKIFLVRDAILHEEMMSQIKQQYCQFGNAMSRLAQGLLHVYPSSQSRISPLTSSRQRNEQIVYNYNLIATCINNQKESLNKQGKQSKRIKNEYNEQPSNQQSTAVIQKIQIYFSFIRFQSQFEGEYQLQKEEMFNQHIQNCIELPSI